jgi:hypothetical protein
MPLDLCVMLARSPLLLQRGVFLSFVVDDQDGIVTSVNLTFVRLATEMGKTQSQPKMSTLIHTLLFKYLQIIPIIGRLLFVPLARSHHVHPLGKS